LPPGDLEALLAELPIPDHPDLLVGPATADDAGVFRIREDLALIQTVDFFTPIVDDPRTFGRIAAANALSDVYAMGGRPLTAMNIVCFPRRSMPLAVLREVLLGGLDVIRQAAALLVGGHSIEDAELKYGLSVTGIVHPERVITNAGARPGDRLILTKPLGTGVLATALKGGVAAPEAVAEAVGWMTTLNAEAAEAMQEISVHACTDITGFGLLGHALELASASRVTLELHASRVPLIAGVRDLAAMGMIPGGSFANRKFCERAVTVADGVDSLLVDLFADAQTSGGLLIAVAADRADALHAALERRGVPHPDIGFVLKEDGGSITLRP
jgi:selenide,water dikinase